MKQLLAGRTQKLPGIPRVGIAKPMQCPIYRRHPKYKHSNQTETQLSEKHHIACGATMAAGGDVAAS